MTSDFPSLFQLFKLLGKAESLSSSNVEIALDEALAAIREQPDLDWEARESAYGIDLLAKKVAQALSLDTAACQVAARAALAPSRAKVAVEVVRELLNELERASG